MRRTLGLAAVILAGCKGGAADPVDFAVDVRPMLADNCARCHGESRLAPGDFLDYETASAWAEVMVDRIDAGEMPPPQADPDCHPYKDDELGQVDPALRDLLTAWIDGGKLEGDLANAPPVSVRTAATLSRQDLVMRTAAPIAPTFVDGNEYRCFLLSDGLEEDGYITGIEFLLDQPQISHHGLLFVDSDSGSEALIEDEASRSWVCPSVFPRPEWYPMHAWAPSGGAVEFTQGRGIRLNKGEQLILQMHYYESAEPVADQPGYALKLASTVERELYYAPIGPDGFVIPAGDRKYTATWDLRLMDFLGLPISFDVYGVMPHMHLLGTGYDFTSIDSEGNEACISRSDDFDFSNQPTYWFEDPVVIDGAGELSVSCTYDNSAGNPNQQNDPPVDVYWGENTQQEMCFALMYVGIH